MPGPEIMFWVCAAVVAYAYVGYPLFLAIAARMRPARRGRRTPAPQSLSIILAARDEARRIGRRVDELAALVAAAGLKGEVVVVSDGSKDGTAAAARAAAVNAVAPVRVIEFIEPIGKAAAVTQGCAAATGEVLIFADTRQTWAPDALRRLLEPFDDSTIGAVSGELVVTDAAGVMGGVGLYWRFEKWLRQTEGKLASTVGVTGAIAAVRRDLFTPIPAGTVLDDVYWPLHVALRGWRVIHKADAIAFDRLPSHPRDEFRRKVRTLAGNLQLIALAPAALLPWRNPVWFQFMSHKIARLIVPWAMLACLVLSAASSRPACHALFLLQIFGWGLGILSVMGVTRWRPACIVGSLLVLNSAALAAFWVWVFGGTGRSWKKVTY